MKRILLVGVLASVLTGGLTACGDGSPPPCEQLGNPSKVEQEAAKGGAEVEREVTYDDGFPNGTIEAECVVVGDRWVDQTDDE